MNRSPQDNHNPRKQSLKLGELGEQLVMQWLQAQGWDILARRWRCRWGELDLIAYQPSDPSLVFIEVKTRSRGNWDADGLLAVSAQKQAKLRKTAELFLLRNTKLADLPCRFDLALVKVEAKLSRSQDSSQRQVILGQAVSIQGYQLTLQDYLTGI